ncbi:MAG: tetratricopeptide repeat protein [Pseudomonadales bacterium]
MRLLSFSSHFNSRFSRQFLCLLVLGFLPTSMLLAETDSPDADSQTQKGEYKTRKATATINLRLYEKLQQAIELNQQGDSAAALAKLDKLKAKAERYNGHELARLWSAYAYIYYQQERFPATVQAYKKALSQQGMPEQLRTELQYSLAQIYFVQQNFAKSLKLLKEWLTKVETPSPQANVFIGQVYYQLQDSKRALPFIEKAVAAYRTEGKKVPENWYLLLNAMYYDLKVYRKSFRVMLALVGEYPKKQYYAQLSALYAELKQESKQFSTQVAMNDAALLDKSAELVGVSQLMLLNQRPYRAARVLEKGFAENIVKRTDKNLQLLANAWMMAREDERALAPLNEAAGLSEKGELYLLLGQSYLNLSRWGEAVTAINHALKNRQLERRDSAHLIRGMALFNLKRYEKSLAAFRQAKKYERSFKLAKQWISYVKSEQQRELNLAELLASQRS